MPKTSDEWTRNRIVQLHNQGVSIPVIAQRLQLTRQAVNAYLPASQAQSKGRSFLCIAPDGKEYKTDNLAAFAREQKLALVALIRCAENKQHMHLGWRCKYILCSTS